MKHGQNNYRKKGGFSFIEVIVAMSLFLILAGIGVGAYFQYYQSALMNADIRETLSLIKRARFEALKNPTRSHYGVHIGPAMRRITLFRDEYSPADPSNVVYPLGQLNVLDLNLNPSPGTTQEILFEKQTGKTANTGTFTLGKDDFEYMFTINSQGIID